MCGRLTLRTPLTVLATRFAAQLGGIERQLPLRYNVAPTQSLVVMRRAGVGLPRELALCSWGLIPAWSKEPKALANTFNARAETVAEKPAFRSAYKQRRCVILTDGYYEWRKEGKQKLPLLYEIEKGQPFALAGLWESWKPRDQTADQQETAAIESCTIITTTANTLASEVHDRMPVILDDDTIDAWINPAANVKELGSLLQPYAGTDLSVRGVSTRVNSVKNDDVACIAPYQNDQLF